MDSKHLEQKGHSGTGLTSYQGPAYEATANDCNQGLFRTLCWVQYWLLGLLAVFQSDMQ